MTSDFEQGKEAARDGKNAADCPFPTGARRNEWLNGFFSAKGIPPDERRRGTDIEETDDTGTPEE
jgi:ribosome modulation factor